LKFATAILLFAVTATTVHTQDVQHAPAVAQCQADAVLWQSQSRDYFRAYKNHDAKNTTIANLTAKELLARSIEMADCLTVDSDHYNDYSTVQSTYVELFGDRVNNFMKRHDLMEQFFKEDAAGLR